MHALFGPGGDGAGACPTQAIVFGTKEAMIAHAEERIEDLKSRGYENAGLYDPQIAPIVENWKGPAKKVGLAAIGLAAVGAALHGIFARPLKVEPEDEEDATGMVEAAERVARENRA